MEKENLIWATIVRLRAFSFFSIAILFIAFGCISSKTGYHTRNSNAKSDSELDYYRFFTEGTKQALLGNYKNAIQIYKSCIEQYPSHAAPYYQLSSIYLKAQEIDKAKNYAYTAHKLDTTNFWYTLQLANIYQYTKLYDSAAFLYEKIVKLNNDPEYLYNLAMIYGQANKENKALEVLDSLADKLGDSKEILLMKHNLYHSLKNYDSAVYELELITTYFSEEPSSYGLLAEYLAEIGRNSYAKKVYNQVLKSDSTNGLLLLSFGDYYMKNTDIDSAFIFYSKAFCCSDLVLDSKISTIVNFIGNKNFILTNSNRVEALLDIILDTKDFRVYASYADLYIRLQKYDQAKPFLDTALFIEKKNYPLWEQSIMVDNYLNVPRDVISKSSEALINFSTQPNLYLFRAYAYKEIDSIYLSLRDTDSVLTHTTEKSLIVQAYNIKAEIYRILNNNTQSDFYFEKIIEIDPENLFVRNNYSYYLSIRNENLERAKFLSSYTIKMEPDNATFLDTYGWILYKMGKVNEAKQYIDEAIHNGAVNNPEVIDHYGEIMMMLNRCKDAIEAWERVLELDPNYSIGTKLSELKAACK